MSVKSRISYGVLICVVGLLASLVVAPASTANTTCLKDKINSNPAKTLRWQEDDYTSRAGEIWVEYEGTNFCGRPIQGWEYRLEIVDVFGDTFYQGTGKVFLKKPVAPGKKFKANRYGGYGVFDLYGSTWKNFEDWTRQRKDDPSGPAYWSYTVLKIV